MADRIVQVILGGEPAGAIAAFDALGTSGAEAADRLGVLFAELGAKVDAVFEGMAERGSVSFDGLGEDAGVSLESISERFDALLTDASGTFDKIAQTATEAASDSGITWSEASTKIAGQYDAMAVAADAAFDRIAAAAEEASTLTGGEGEAAAAKIAEAYDAMAADVSAAYAKIDESADAAAAGSDEAAATTESAWAGAGTAVLAGAAIVGAAVYESVKAADTYDTAMAALDTSVKNNGQTLGSFAPQLAKVDEKMASFGFNSTETAEALTPLETASGSSSKAFNALGIAANLARLKHISLSSASGILTKVFAGSTRALTTLGLNLDIGSGKLAGIQTAEESVTKAQLALKNTQEGIADGSIKAGQAGTALQLAHQNLSDAEQKLALDQGTVAKILDTVKQKTNGAAAAYKKTLAGSVDTAKAAFHNFETEAGEKLIPILTKVAGIAAKVATYIMNNKALMAAIAVVIGGAVVAALGVMAAIAAAVVVSLALMAISIAILLVPLALFAFAVYKIVTSWSTITGFFDRLWGDVEDIFKSAVSDVTGFVKHLWSDIESIFGTEIGAVTTIVKVGWDLISGQIQAAMAVIEAIIQVGWDLVKGVFQSTWSVISGVVNAAWDVIHGVIAAGIALVSGVIDTAMALVEGHWSAAWNDIKSTFSSIVGDLVGAATGFGVSIINGIVGGIESMAGAIGNAIVAAVKGAGGAVRGAINSLPVVGGFLSHIPGLATGGYVTSPTLAMVGEDGPEFVIPANQVNVGGIQALPAGLARGGGSGGGITGNTFIINVANPNANGQDLVNALRNWIQSNGSLANAGLS